MALNTSHTNDGKGVLIYNGERILIYTKEINLTFSGNPDPAFTGKKKGSLYLTSHRVVFVNKDQRDRLLSLSIPFHCLQNVKLEQPIMGANYLKGAVLAQPGGNWEGDCTFQMTFNLGGCIEFGKALLHANQLAARAGAVPPPYAPPGGIPFQAPPAYYTTGQQNFYGFSPPTQAFPDAPPAGSVYMWESPPPYSGIGPAPPPYPVPGGYAKGNEAGGYGASNQANGVMDAPPSYDQATKKNN